VHSDGAVSTDLASCDAVAAVAEDVALLLWSVLDIVQITMEE